MAAGVHFGRTHPGESCTDVSSVKAGVGRRQECPCVCREGDRVLAQVRSVARQDGSVVSLGLCHSSSGQQDKCEGLNNTAAWEQRQKGGKKSCSAVTLETEKYRSLSSWEEASSCLI